MQYAGLPEHFTKADTKTINMVFNQDNTGVLVNFYRLQFVLSDFVQHLASHFG